MAGAGSGAAKMRIQFFCHVLVPVYKSTLPQYVPSKLLHSAHYKEYVCVVSVTDSNSMLSCPQQIYTPRCPAHDRFRLRGDCTLLQSAH